MDTTASCPDGPGGTGTGVESHRPAGSFGLGGALAAGDSLVAVEPLGAAVVGVVEVAVALGVLFFDPPATAAIMMMRTTTPTPSPIQRPVRFLFGGVWDGGDPADPAGGGVYVGTPAGAAGDGGGGNVGPADPAGGGVYVGTPTGAAGDGGGGNGGAPGARCGGYHLPSDAIHQPTPCEVSLIVRPNLSALAERSALSEHNYRRDASWELGEAVQIL